MLVSELKPLEEILASLEGETSVFLLGCGGCAEACHAGGEGQVRAMRSTLEESGKAVMGSAVVDFLCDRALVRLRLAPRAGEVARADSVLVLACGIGIQVVAASVSRPVHPGCNTLAMGGARGEWRGAERCRECGDCLLDLTGGLCPLTACTKGLLNGGCGGARNGRCEFEPELRECGWHLIYERLRSLGRLDKLVGPPRAKGWSRMQPSKAVRTSTLWALEMGSGGAAGSGKAVAP